MMYLYATYGCRPTSLPLLMFTEIKSTPLAGEPLVSNNWFLIGKENEVSTDIAV